jgi:L-iditol 2-dehydrogenase
MIAVHIADTCRSDVHFWRTGRIGSLIVQGDCILGHEAAGVVLQCGEGVRNLKPGKVPSQTESYSTFNAVL